jgi:hypothetical protein
VRKFRVIPPEEQKAIRAEYERLMAKYRLRDIERQTEAAAANVVDARPIRSS